MGEIKNLLLSEVFENFSKNILYSKLNINFFPHYEDFNTSAFMPLLKEYDESKTCGKISFLPIKFLRDMVGPIDLNFIDEEEEKSYLLKKFSTERIIDDEYLKTQLFEDVPLIYFKKIYLNSSLPKTCDISILYRTIKEDLLEDVGINTSDIKPNHEIAEHFSKKEWMYLTQLYESTIQWLYILESEYRNDITLIEPYYYKFPIIPEKKTRFYIGFILKMGHFTSYIIDTKCPSKHTIKKNIYFFDSCGYSENFGNRNNFWLIKEDMDFRKIQFKPSTDYNNIFIELYENFDNIFKLNYAFFNKFKVQYGKADCGGFSSFFIRQFILKYDSLDRNKLDFRTVQSTYYNTYSHGYDLMMGLNKGLIFFTIEDLEANNIDRETYDKSLKIYPVNNRKFLQYKKLYEKSSKYFSKI